MKLDEYCSHFFLNYFSICEIKTKKKMKKILITGGNRGIGNAFVKRYLKEKDHFVIASVRKSSCCENLDNLLKEHNNLEILEADFEEESSIEKLSKHIEEKHSKIDLLLNIPGILIPEKNLNQIDLKVLHQVFQINSFVLTFFNLTINFLIQSINDETIKGSLADGETLATFNVQKSK